jgi:BirA family transcriptional regulator, biotin operon repressor / biotin---[acetyl-CoA-carboxylase] ligase
VIKASDAAEAKFLAGLATEVQFLRALPHWRHLALGDVGSTNDLALAAARSGDEGQLWITAERQLSGRGRRGRAWVSEPGNLYASALLVLAKPDPTALGSLPLVAGLALHDALSRIAPQHAPALGLKWPNDLLLGKAKLAGILLEGTVLPDARHAVVLGFGVNLAHAPTGTAFPATTLASHGAEVAPSVLLPHLALSLNAMLETWNDGKGLAAIVALWRKLAVGLGQPIRVNLPDQSLEGRFADIDPHGYLLLDTGPAGLLRIAAGDVFLLN